MEPRFTLATGDYDRVRALWDGSVSPTGFSLEVKRLPVDEIFRRMVQEEAYDISEMSLSTYLILKSREACPFVAVPVFPSKKFRHGDIYVRSDSTAQSPADLKGGRIGVPEYQLTAAVWLRGLFEEVYGVMPEDVFWRTGGLDTPGRTEKVPLKLPEKIQVAPIDSDQTLNQMLLDGALDAVISPKSPSGFLSGTLKRLMPDYPKIERTFYDTYRVFPIMHTVVIRQKVYEQCPGLACEIYRLYQKALELCFERYHNTMALPVSLPWFDVQMQEMRNCMGAEIWNHGIHANERELKVFSRYMYTQGLIPVDWSSNVKELFASETRDI